MPHHVWNRMTESNLYQESKLLFFTPLQKYSQEYAFVIWAYFYHKPVAFMWEYVHLFALNTV